MVNLLFPVWLSSVSVITSWSTHVAAKAVLHFRGWVLFHGTDWLHLPVRASVQAAFGACSCHQCRVNFEAHLSFQIMVFLDIRLRSGVAQQCGSSVFSVWRTCTLFSIVAAACIHSSKHETGGSCFMHALAFLRSLWIDCLLMAIVTDARRYLPAVLTPSCLKRGLMEHV